MRKIMIVGKGYAALFNAMLLAQNNRVIAIDIDEEKISIQAARPERNTEIPNVSPASSIAPSRVFNIGNNNVPTPLMTFTAAIERPAEKEAKNNYMPMQPSYVPATLADIDSLQKEVGLKPDTYIEYGIQ